MNKPSERFDDWHYPEFDEGGMSEYNWMCKHRDNLELSEYTDIGAFVFINAKEGVVIEKDVQVGPHTSIISSSSIDNKRGKIILKENCRIGAQCTIMPDVEIGKNSIIGANSLVKKNIPPNVVAYGTPVEIRKRISKE